MKLNQVVCELECKLKKYKDFCSFSDVITEMAMEDDEEQEENAEVPASEPGPSDAPAEG